MAYKGYRFIPMSLFNDKNKEIDSSQTTGVKPLLTLQEVRRAGRQKLLELVEPALMALQSAITSPDKEDAMAVKAACAVLDRTGFGVHSTITIDDKTDYSRLSDAELMNRLDAAKRQVEANLLAKSKGSKGIGGSAGTAGPVASSVH